LAGEPDRLREGLIQAEDSFKQALERNPNDWDAKHNYELVDGMLKSVRTTVDEFLKFVPEGGNRQITELPPNKVG
jgi:hypothetical protein